MKIQKKSVLDAHYKCQKCKFEWKVRPHPVTCPKCGHGYSDWLNWEEVVNATK